MSSVPGSVALPRRIAEIADGKTVRVAWLNALGGVTCEYGEGADRWKADPATAGRSIGEGLRALHDALPVGRCPFSWSALERVADAGRRAAADPDRTRYYRLLWDLGP